MKKRIAFAVILAVLAMGILPSFTLAGGGGEVPGCPPAHHVGGFLGPWDGGDWYHPHQGHPRLAGPAIAHLWWNLDSPSVANDPRNPGEPYWGQQEIKVMIPANARVRFVGAAGQWWKYQNNESCRHNLPYEFQQGSQPIHSLNELVSLGLARVR